MRSFLALAGWQSGYAAACKAVDAGSIPTSASKIKSTFVMKARVAKLVDARDLKSLGIISRAGSTPAPGTSFVGPPSCIRL
jgi:hypothetical protein